MIPGVGVPHRRVRHHNHSFRVNSTQTESLFLRERQNPSTDLSETALKARQRLEKKLGHCCLQLSSRFLLFLFSSFVLFLILFFVFFFNNIEFNYCFLLDHEHRSSDNKQTKDGRFSGSSKLVKISRPWKSQSTNKVDESNRKINRSDSDVKLCSCY